MNNLTVIDFFCGAGGFSEGFKQQGFKVIHGVDNWKPAIDTFNYNFGLSSATQDIIEFGQNLELIEKLPNTDIIIGSPPCVSFSNSNTSGNANKTLGINLIEIYLKIIAVKKHQPNSKLKAWFMENVINSIKHTKDKYTFKDLDLVDWAKDNKINPRRIAINLKDNYEIINSADYGVPQIRKRLFAGEIINKNKFPQLKKTHGDKHITVKNIFRYFPSPFKNQKRITDPNYKHIKLNNNLLTDYDYDSGIYKSHWDYSKWSKVNHPYMGKMSFPENKNNPSRTITATKLDNSREALIYDSEIKRQGNGQYRTPTIREIAVLMSFPITYQFLGSEGIKWRLVGNAVCPLVSNAIAKATLKAFDKTPIETALIETKPNLKGVNNLNSKQQKIFDKPPKFKKGKRFRRHPFKDGNMTVALSNYCLKENPRVADNRWRTTITYGTGINYKIQEFSVIQQKKIHQFILDNFDDGLEFINKIHNGFSGKIAKSKELQDMYEKNYSNGKAHPVELIEMTKRIVEEYANGEVVKIEGIFKYKNNVHKKQLYALYAINQINKITNKRGE